MKTKEHATYIALLRKQERKAVATVEGSVVDRMRDELVPMFKKPWDERAPMTDFRTGRRVGKSEYLVRLGFRGSYENGRSINPLILPTAKQARRVFWPMIKRVLARHFPDVRPNDTRMEVTMPGGGMLVCGGCEHEEDVGKWFGNPFEEGIVDECGNFKKHIRALINDALVPGTMDFRGRITRSGNPGILCDGPWWEWTGDHREIDTPLYTGDARCNPYLPDPQEFFDLILAQNRWTEKSPTFLRMYLGQWCKDLGALCYPWAEDGTNFVNELPTETETGDPVNPLAWRYGIGMDVGYVDLTTWVVLAVHPALRQIYVVYAEGHPQWIDSQKVERTLQLRERFPNALVVIDPGGGGKNVIETLRRGKPGRPSLPCQVAEKQEKIAGIRDVRDAIIDKTMLALPAAAPYIEECNVLGWDDKREQHDPNGADHYCDAGLYIYRAMRHLSFDPKLYRPPPRPGTAAYFEAELKKYKRQFTHPMFDTRRRPQWDH